MWQEKRTSVRHPVELPIKYRVIGLKRNAQELQESSFRHSATKNVSDGGLLFSSSEHYQIGTTLQLNVPAKDKVFMLQARVAHTERDGGSGNYFIGVEFVNPASLFKVKMAEQLHQIKRFHELLSKQLGQPVTEEEAAQRWIEEHSRKFSKFYQ